MANSEIRVGRVSSVNYETGMARITYWDKDETVTSEFPMLNYNNEYRMPEVGQDVMVAHLSNGTSRGVILGTLWNERYAPLETGAALYRKDFSRKKDAAYVRYDDKLGEYLIKVANLHLNGVNETVLDVRSAGHRGRSGCSKFDSENGCCPESGGKWAGSDNTESCFKTSGKSGN